MEKQSGRSTIELLVLIFLVVIGTYTFFIEPHLNNQMIESLRNQHPPQTADDIKLVHRFKTKPSPESILSGSYFWRGKIDGADFEFSYSFGKDAILTKTASLQGQYHFKGSAKYSFEGSVLIFNDITGDRSLFSDIGEPITVKNEDLIILEDHSKSFSIKSSKLFTLQEKATKKAAKEAALLRKEMHKPEVVLSKVFEAIRGASIFEVLIFLFLFFSGALCLWLYARRRVDHF